MHEMGIALEICRIAESHAGARTPLVKTVAVIVGDDAAVEPSSLEFCLETLLGAPPFAGAKPKIVRERGDALRVDYLEVDDARDDD